MKTITLLSSLLKRISRLFFFLFFTLYNGIRVHGNYLSVHYWNMENRRTSSRYNYAMTNIVRVRVYCVLLQYATGDVNETRIFIDIDFVENIL